MLSFLLIYLGVGCVNVAHAWWRGTLMAARTPQHRGREHHLRLDAGIEVLFYLLLWPIQLLFWTVVGISSLVKNGA